MHFAVFYRNVSQRERQFSFSALPKFNLADLFFFFFFLVSVIKLKLNAKIKLIQFRVQNRVTTFWWPKTRTFGPAVRCWWSMKWHSELTFQYIWSLPPPLKINENQDIFFTVIIKKINERTPRTEHGNRTFGRPKSRMSKSNWFTLLVLNWKGQMIHFIEGKKEQKDQPLRCGNIYFPSFSNEWVIHFGSKAELLRAAGRFVRSHFSLVEETKLSWKCSHRVPQLEWQSHNGDTLFGLLA